MPNGQQPRQHTVTSQAVDILRHNYRKEMLAKQKQLQEEKVKRENAARLREEKDRLREKKDQVQKAKQSKEKKGERRREARKPSHPRRRQQVVLPERRPISRLTVDCHPFPPTH